MKTFHGNIGDCPSGYVLVSKLGEDYWEIEKMIDFEKVQRMLAENNRVLVKKISEGL